MDRNHHFVWTRAAAALGLLATAMLLLWLLVSPQWALIAGCVGLLALLWRQLSNVSALSRWLRDPGQPVPQGSGLWEGIFSGLYRWTRESTREHERLTLALARFRSAGTAMPDGVIILNAGNHIEWCNPTAERYFSVDTIKDAGQQIINLVRPPDFAAYLERGDFSEPLTLRLSRAEGLVLSLRIIPYGHDQKLLLSRDITQIERVEAMRRDFVANVSHELKTPLTVVNGFVETLADGKVKFSDSRIRQVLDLMQQQTSRMLNLVEDLLTLSALESSPVLVDETDISIEKLLEGLRTDGEALSGGHHRLVLAMDRPMLLVGNENDLRSAFGNLVSNAVHYTPKGGEIRLSWRQRETGEGEFAVTDSGVGIDSRHIPRLTERFYRVDSSRSRETGGTGLGLAIAKHVLTRHQATLEISSEPGRGSCFMAVFPKARLRQTAATPDSADSSAVLPVKP